ncbi:hypothetical protein ABTK92_19245, partial [Acinetobacter baumannii]
YNVLIALPSKTYAAGGTSRSSNADAADRGVAIPIAPAIPSHRNIPCWTFSCWRSASASSWQASVTPMPANGCEEEIAMTFDYSLAALVAVGLLF